MSLSTPSLAALPPRRADPGRARRAVEDAKKIAVAAFGEALAQRLYPKARFRSEQWQQGGSDFALPGGAYLEAKAAAVGKRLQVHAQQLDELLAPGSRVLVAVYNRQLVTVRHEEERVEAALWVDALARSITLLLDVPGDFFVAAIERRAAGSRERGYQIPVVEYIKIVAAARPNCQLVERLDFRVLGERVSRHGLAMYIVGERSPHLFIDAVRTRVPSGRRKEAPF